MTELDPWYLSNLVCPVDRSDLRLDGAFLVSMNDRRYPVVEGMPVMLVSDASQTIDVANITLRLAHEVASGERADDTSLYVETLGVTNQERAAALALHRAKERFDSVVAVMIAATSGNAYRHLTGAGTSYPIPAFRFPTPKPGRLLDVGCNWGRWTISAGLAGHLAVGIDPQLGSVLAARRVATQLGVPAHFVVADARFLPFREGTFDYAWSYSVLQHFSHDDAQLSLEQLRRVLRSGGLCRVQMANAFGLRSLFQLTRRGFREPVGFEVRYWPPRELKRVFSKIFGNLSLEADCFLGLGLQWSDFERMNWAGKSGLCISESLRRLSVRISPVRWVADSLFCTSVVGR